MNETNFVSSIWFSVVWFDVAATDGELGGLHKLPATNKVSYPAHLTPNFCTFHGKQTLFPQSKRNKLQASAWKLQSYLKYQNSRPGRRSLPNPFYPNKPLLSSNHAWPRRHATKATRRSGPQLCACTVDCIHDVERYFGHFRLAITHCCGSLGIHGACISKRRPSLLVESRNEYSSWRDCGV